MVVQHNMPAMTANRYYTQNNSSLSKSLEKLSSGYSINRAGDNAAGLAVSEKMRAQISGLTQASKNAEDGISMVQTYEGALQETDSILQRMRTIAVQSANGSYQDDVDRDAMQLEFDQLNDELNQIADTDFNGVVVLNGGVMADGVKADALGKIDYATKKDDVTKTTQKNLQANLDSAQKAYNSAKAEFMKNKYDLSSNGDADEWNTLDNHLYNKNVADEVWATFGFTNSAGDKADTTQADTIAVTFTYDGTNWRATSADASLNGETVKTFDTAFLQGSTAANDKLVTTKNNENVSSAAASTGSTGEGGFNVKLKEQVSGLKDQNGTAIATNSTNQAGQLGNAVFDAVNVKEGDTVTLVYRNSDPNQKAFKNMAINQDSVINNVIDKDSKTITDKEAIKFESKLTDVNVDDSITKAMEALEDAEFSVTYDKEADFAAGHIKIAGQEVGIGAADTTGTTQGTAKQININGTALYASSTAAGVTSLFAKNDTGNFIKLAEVTLVADAADSDTAKDAGTLTFKVSSDATKYNPAKTITIDVGDDPSLESSALYTDKLNKADKALADAQKKLTEFSKLDNTNDRDWTKIKEMFAETQSSSGGIVSISDSYDQSKAKLTFADNMSLQVGARTKDIVDFKFSYNTNDLGGLEANMNCSAREGGLNTASLSVKTQQSANDAIDRIDKALNKVSMVRATFGGIQNRLEHKISNINTNTENLTAAESRIRDTQMDQEMMKFTSAQILSQASQSMLAQANSLPQGVLQLLG